MKATLFCFSGTLLIGVLIGWLSFSGNRGDLPDGASKQASSSSHHSRERPIPTTAGLVEQSKAWMKDINEKGFNPYSEEIENWTNQEIESALEECLGNRDFLMNSKNARHLASGLLREWLSRDCAAASKFFLTIPAPIRIGTMTYSFSMAWPADHAKEGLAFVKENPHVFQGASPWSILLKNIEAHAADGVPSLIALLSDLRAANLGLAFENPVSMPAGFDYSRLMNSPEMDALTSDGQGKFFIRAWYKVDREACFDWIKEKDVLASLPSLPSFDDNDPAEGLRWIGTKYETMSPSDRETIVKSIRAGNSVMVQNMAEGMADPKQADEFRAIAVRWITIGPVAEAMKVLGSIPDPAIRVQLLENAEFNRMPNSRQVSPANLQMLRNHLEEWNASSEKTEAIMKKLQSRQ